MKKILTILTITFSSALFAQVATFDSAAASNALTVIEKSTETVSKLDALRESTEKTLTLVTSVNSAISTGFQVENIFKYQAEIIQSIDDIRRKLRYIDDTRLLTSYNKILLSLIEETNYLMMKTSSVINSGVLSMNDYERLSMLSDIEQNLESLASSSKRLIKKI